MHTKFIVEHSDKCAPTPNPMQAFAVRFQILLNKHACLGVSVHTVTNLQVNTVQKCFMEQLTPTKGSRMESKALEGAMT